MITIQQKGKSYLIMSNTNRTVMKIGYDDIAAYKESLTTPVKERSATAGVDFISVALVSVLQMDKLDDSNVLLLQRRSNGNLDLRTVGAGKF